MYFNCRSIVPKFDELVCLCFANKPSMFVSLKHGFAQTSSILNCISLITPLLDKIGIGMEEE